jgi:hypothetical protein
LFRVARGPAGAKELRESGGRGAAEGPLKPRQLPGAALSKARLEALMEGPPESMADPEDVLGAAQTPPFDARVDGAISCERIWRSGRDVRFFGCRAQPRRHGPVVSRTVRPPARGGPFPFLGYDHGDMANLLVDWVRRPCCRASAPSISLLGTGVPQKSSPFDFRELVWGTLTLVMGDGR